MKTTTPWFRDSVRSGKRLLLIRNPDQGALLACMRAGRAAQSRVVRLAYQAYRQVMRKTLLVSIAIVLLVAAAAVVYHLASPKVELQNLSGETLDEFRLQLPSSRVTVGPIAPGEFERVYFSLQSNGGEAQYSLWSGGKQIGYGSLQYSSTGQLFRKIAVVIRLDGSVGINVSD